MPLPMMDRSRDVEEAAEGVHYADVPSTLLTRREIATDTPSRTELPVLRITLYSFPSPRRRPRPHLFRNTIDFVRSDEGKVGHADHLGGRLFDDGDARKHVTVLGEGTLDILQEMQIDLENDLVEVSIG